MTTNYLKLKEVAERLRVSGMTIHRLIEKGELKAIRVGHLWRISEDSLTEYIERTNNRP